MGWTKNNDSLITVHTKTGDLTYDGAIPYCNCQNASDFNVNVKLSRGEGCREIEITSEHENCENEWLVTWFNNGTNYSYDHVLNENTNAKKILQVKNVDDCSKVVYLNDPNITAYQFFGGENGKACSFTDSSYTDCGIPHLITSSTNVSCAQKYNKNQTYPGHKIKYKPISDTIPNGFITNNTDLVEIYFPARFDDDKFKNTKVISAGAFSANTRLSAVTFSKVETIGEKAFYNCTNLQLVDWGCCLFDEFSHQQNDRQDSKLKVISAEAFSNCSFNGINLSFPKSLERIGASAFTGCSFTSVTFPAEFSGSSHIIGDHAFSGCSSLTSVTVKATTPPILGSGAFDGTNNCPIYVPSGSVTAYKAASGWSIYESRIQAIP